ncbi:MAG: response regulator, partial [Aliifodinibius sp.]|nr:response regulator transcription factor [Fodinibius sp.]NIW43401.1 response regulator [Gammaproteobacteria bacterium]NIY23587.1 response regulator [Fodinibius sp.]
AQLHPDVVVLDIQMPKASGIEVTRWVRQHHREIGILILTAYDDDPYVMAVIQAGANGYVLKTASPDEIIQAVKDV